MDKDLMENRKKKILEFIKSDEYKPMRSVDMAYLLQVEHEERHLFADILRSLEAEGYVMVTKRGKIMPVEAQNLIRGTFSAHARGFGFVAPDEGEKDIFIEPSLIGGAMNKDVVLCRIIQPEGAGRRPEGEIIKILQRGMSIIVGTFVRHDNHCFVIPDDKKIPVDIYISKKNAQGIVNGHKVVVKIIKPASETAKNPEGKITEILGHINEPGVDILSIVKQFELPVEFGEKVQAEAERVSQHVEAAELENRLDLRHLQTVTIDSDDALDLDDAITLEKSGEFYRLGVHIADVCNYVKEGSTLDVEALKRGTSVYLADRVIPMLPVQLSNGICSLNAGADRLALSCIMDIDAQGNVIAHKIAETVIFVDKRCSYDGVSSVIDEGITDGEYADFVSMFTLMNELKQILSAKRIKRGCIAFDFPETKIKLDEAGKPVEIAPRIRGIASEIIEEFMLICNESVAEEYFWLEAPFIYRSHEEPDGEKMEKLTEFLRHFGYFLKGKANHPKNIQALLNEIKDKPEEMVISKAALRSLKQARYTSENMGHFGLAAKYYCHFTSPIRRYPDLQIHRIIKDNLSGRLADNESRYAKKIIEVAKHSSITERTAEEAEREVENLKKVQFMADSVGEVFDAIVSGITSYGVFVTLPNTIEGMVSLAHMEDDFYVFDERNMEIIGRQAGKIYALGQLVCVKLINADLHNRRLDFVILPEDE